VSVIAFSCEGLTRPMRARLVSLTSSRTDANDLRDPFAE